MKNITCSIIALYIVLMISGCAGHHNNHNHIGHEHEGHEHEGHEHGHKGHEHESENKGHNHVYGETKYLITGYNSGIEVFAETDPLAVNTKAEMLVHLTKLSDFKPLTETTLKITFSVNGNNAGVTEAVKIRDGIYKTGIEPLISGMADMVIEIPSASGIIRVNIPEVIISADKHTAIHVAEDAEISSQSAVVFTKEQGWKTGFATAMPDTNIFRPVIKSTGIIELSPENQVTIVSKAAGIVRFTGAAPIEGEVIVSGKQLCTISSAGSAESNISVQYAEAKNNMDKAEAELSRIKPLAEEKLVTANVLQEAVTAAKNARVRFEEINRQFNSAGQSVTSPLTGNILSVYVKNGDYVETGQPIASVGVKKSVHIHAGIPVRYAGKLKNLESANIKIPSTGKSFSLNEVNGSIVATGIQVNSDNLIPVVVKINNPENFVPGGFAEVYFLEKPDKNLISVPNQALLESEGQYYLFVQLTPELFEQRMVKTGSTDGINTEITEGILTTERVVTRGAVAVKLAKASGALDPHAGHVH